MLAAVFAATLGIPEVAGSRYSADGARELLTAASIVRDGDVDVANQYATHQQRAFRRAPLHPRGRATNGRLDEPYGVGFPLLIAPGFAIAGATGVEVELALFAALAFVLAGRLARRLAPEPWAGAAALLVGLSAPVLGGSTAVEPDLVAAAALAGGALLALRVREEPRLATAVWCALLIAALPWLGARYIVPGVVLAAALLRWLRRRQRGLAAFVAGEVVLTSVVAWVAMNEQLFGGPTPSSAERPGVSLTGAHGALDHLARIPRLAGLWLDRDAGLLRWAPFLALAFAGLWLLWRSRRDRLALLAPEQVDAEVAGGLCALLIAAQLLVAAFLWPSVHGAWFPGRHLLPVLPMAAALAAWGLRHAPRTGALLGAVTLAASAWLLAALHAGDGSWADPPGVIPWGPLRAAFPLIGIVGLVLLAAALWRRRRAGRGLGAFLDALEQPRRG